MQASRRHSMTQSSKTLLPKALTSTPILPMRNRVWATPPARTNHPLQRCRSRHCSRQLWREPFKVQL